MFLFHGLSTKLVEKRSEDYEWVDNMIIIFLKGVDHVFRLSIGCGQINSLVQVPYLSLSQSKVNSSTRFCQI